MSKQDFNIPLKVQALVKMAVILSHFVLGQVREWVVFFSYIYPVLVFGFYRCKLLQALVSLFELPKDESTPDDEHFIEIEDTPGICITM